MSLASYNPKNYNGGTAPSKPETMILRDAAVIDIEAVRKAPQTIALTLAPEALLDGEVHSAFAKMPVAGTVTAAEFVAVSNATGDGTVGGTLVGGGNSLLAANVDLKTGIDGTLKAGTLTATVAHRTLAAGALVKASMAAAGTSGGAAGLTCIITFIPD